MAPKAAQAIRYVGPIFFIAGLLAGIYLTVLPLSVSHNRVALASILFFVGCNRIPSETSEAWLLGCVCAAISFFLGYGGSILFGMDLFLSGGDSSSDRSAYLRIPLFLLLVMMFHSVEFLFAVLFHPKDVEFRAFLLTPVPYGAYSIAMIAAIFEHYFLRFLLGGLMLGSYIEGATDI